MHNPVTALSADASFENLRSINLSHTCVSGWHDVGKLRDFPKLSELRMQAIPLLQVKTCFECISERQCWQ